MKPMVSLLKRLRNYVVARMHIGHLNPGDQLPSYRELSERWSIDHRMVARAYRALETEGLVEIRGRAGVFLQEQKRIAGEMLPDTARWVASDVLTEAWQRRIKIPELPRYIHRCTASVELRTACMDSTEDHRHLLCQELREWFGFRTEGIAADRLPEHAPDRPLEASQIDRLPKAVRRADLLVTTSFHAHRVRPVADALRKPHVIVSMHPIAVEIFLNRLREGPLTVVCVDPRFADRLKSIAGPAREDLLRVVVTRDRKAVNALDPDQPMLVSRAAQDKLDRRLPSIMQDVPAFSPDCAAELSFLLIRLNLEAASASD